MRIQYDPVSSLISKLSAVTTSYSSLLKPDGEIAILSPLYHFSIFSTQIFLSPFLAFWVRRTHGVLGWPKSSSFPVTAMTLFPGSMFGSKYSVGSPRSPWSSIVWTVPSGVNSVSVPLNSRPFRTKICFARSLPDTPGLNRSQPLISSRFIIAVHFTPLASVVVRLSKSISIVLSGGISISYPSLGTSLLLLSQESVDDHCGHWPFPGSTITTSSSTSCKLQ